MHRYDDVITTANSSKEEGISCSVSDSDHQLLLSSFSEFRSTFEARMCSSGDHSSVQLDPHTSRFLVSHLQELQAALLHPPLLLDPNQLPSSSRLSSSCLSPRNSVLGSGSSELMHLRHEVERLRQVQKECEGLSAQVKASQVQTLSYLKKAIHVHSAVSRHKLPCYTPTHRHTH